MPAAFAAFDEALKLDPDELKAARVRRDEISECLMKALLAASVFMQGSLARATMLKPLKDVDLVVVLTREWAVKLRGKGGPATAMKLFRTAVAKAFPEARFDVDGRPAHALQIVFDDCDFTFDLVPAIDVPDSEDVLIADRDEDAWEPSNVRKLNRVVRERNHDTNGRFVHQVRMLKSFKRDHPVLDDTKGILWEALVFGAVTAELPDEVAVTQTLQHAVTALTGVVLDPTGVDDLTAQWTEQERADRVDGVAHAVKQAQEALELEDQAEHQAAVGLWHTILGDPFPSVPQPPIDMAWEILPGGAITSDGRPVKTPRAHQPVRAGRSWRSR